jgi:hypothetical protein
MAIAVYFNPEKLTAEQYNEIHRRLEAIDEHHNPNRLHHSGFGPDDAMMVYDIWESAEAFEAFGEVLGPILAEVGVDVGQPTIMPVHKIIQREADL